MNEFVGYIDDQGRVFDGTFDYEGHVGPIGPQGEPGYTPQRGVDYWTDEDKAYVVAEATSLINGKIEEYNDNATAKTNAFNQNASDKTNAYNNNASDKTTAFNNNASDKTDAFNSNATSKTGAFNDNASDKTTDFNSNATSKTGDFNDNATSKTSAFDAHVDSEFDDLTGNFYTKAQVDAKIASTYHYKGSVTDYTELPSSGQQVGDVYNIETAGGGYNAGDNVAWTGSAWDKLAGTVDLTNYYTKSETNTLLDTKQGTIDSSHKVDADLIDDTTSTNKFTTSSNISKLAGIESGAEVNVIETVKVDGTALEVTDKAVDIVGLAQLQQENLAQQQELDALYAQIPTATATGNPINVQDSSNLPIKEFTMLGNATQQTYTGKNLFNAELFGTFTSQLQYITVTLSPNTQYTMSSNLPVASGLGANLFFMLDGESAGSGVNDIRPDLARTLTTDSTGVVKIGYRDGNNNLDDEKHKYWYMIQTGSTATAYEPYTGGTPAPNPDYPQDIHVVTGDNTVKVVNKNILLMENDAKTWRTNTWSFSKGLFIFNNTDGSNSNNLLGNKIANVIIPSGTKITLSMKYISGSIDSGSATQYFRFGIRVLFDDNTTSDILMPTSAGYTYANYKTAGTLTYTTSALSKKVVGIYIKPNTGYNTATNFTCQVQVEIGENATDWAEPTEQTQLLSLGSIELAKIGTYTDRIFKDSGKWYVEKNTGEYTLSTLINWYITGDTNYQISIAGDSRIYLAQSAKGLSNYFSVKSSGTDTFMYPILQGNVDYIRIQNATTKWETLEAFKTWLSAHTVTLLYPTSHPTTTEITDTTLLGQLENILAMHTNKNVTNISIVPTGTNTEPTAEVEYRVDLGTVISNLNARVTLLE